MTDTYVANILAVYDRAGDAERDAGMSWYGDARRIVDAIGGESRRAVVAHVLAALSPRNPWLWNVQDTFAYVTAYQAGLPMPVATTFTRNRLAAWRALSGDEPWTSAAPKVRNFVAAIIGDPDAVVVDTWAYRVATGTSPENAGQFPARLYEPIAEAYREAARRVGITPAAMQAITWVTLQRETGKLSHAGYKAGTADFVREITS